MRPRVGTVTEVQAEWVAAWATAAGAAATAITGGIIAAQTIATRHSVQVSQAVQLQSARARLDARAPRVSLTVGAVRWPPHRLAASDVTRPRGAPVMVGEQFHMPGDASLILLLEAQGQLRNDGDRTLSLQVGQPLMPWADELELPDQSQTSITSQRGLQEENRRSQERMQLQLAPTTTVTLAPGAVQSLRLCQKVTVADLIAADSEAATMAPVHLVVDDGFDEGVTDTYTLAVRGSALTPVLGDAAGYTVTGPSVWGAPPLNIPTAVINRRYFFSKTNGQEMPT